MSSVSLLRVEYVNFERQEGENVGADAALFAERVLEAVACGVLQEAAVAALARAQTGGLLLDALDVQPGVGQCARECVPVGRRGARQQVAEQQRVRVLLPENQVRLHALQLVVRREAQRTWLLQRRRLVHAARRRGARVNARSKLVELVARRVRLQEETVMIRALQCHFARLLNESLRFGALIVWEFVRANLRKKLSGEEFAFVIEELLVVGGDRIRDRSVLHEEELRVELVERDVELIDAAFPHLTPARSAALEGGERAQQRVPFEQQVDVVGAPGVERVERGGAPQVALREQEQRSRRLQVAHRSRSDLRERRLREADLKLAFVPQRLRRRRRLAVAGRARAQLVRTADALRGELQQLEAVLEPVAVQVGGAARALLVARVSSARAGEHVFGGREAVARGVQVERLGQVVLTQCGAVARPVHAVQLDAGARVQFDLSLQSLPEAVGCLRQAARLHQHLKRARNSRIQQRERIVWCSNKCSTCPTSNSVNDSG